MNASLVDRLRAAQDIVNRAQIDESLRPAAFTEVYRALIEGGGGPVERGAEDDAGHRVSAKAPGGAPDASTRLTAVAKAFGVDGSVVSQLFAEEGEELQFVLPTRHLAKSTRGAMRQVVILVTCARQAGGWDRGWTTSATLRRACESAEAYSSKHFNSELSNLDVFATRVSAGVRELRAHAKSYDAARAVLAEIGLLDDADAS